MFSRLTFFIVSFFIFMLLALWYGKQSNEPIIGTIHSEFSKSYDIQSGDIIVSINGNTDREQIVKYIQMMPIRDSQFIRKFINDSEPRLDLNKKTQTPSGEMIDVNISFGVDFFRPFFGL